MHTRCDIDTDDDELDENNDEKAEDVTMMETTSTVDQSSAAKNMYNWK
jgi:hypothetical protein